VIDPERARAFMRDVFAGLDSGTPVLEGEECG
jgi:hypothetical protein